MTHFISSRYGTPAASEAAMALAGAVHTAELRECRDFSPPAPTGVDVLVAGVHAARLRDEAAERESNADVERVRAAVEDAKAAVDNAPTFAAALDAIDYLHAAQDDLAIAESLSGITSGTPADEEDGS